MAARGGAKLHLQLQQMELESNFQKNLTSLLVKGGLGPGWLRAVAQGYNYSCNKMELVINFQKTLQSCLITYGWGLDGCARWRKVTITITIKLI